MCKLLTKKDVAERWQVDESTIDRYRRDGIIIPCKGLPTVRFTEQHIAEIEGLKLEKTSPIERKRLERELEEWKLRAVEAETALAQASLILTEALYSKQKQNKVS